MWVIVPSRKIEDLCEQLRPLAVQFKCDCEAVGAFITITCTYRSAEEQNALYAQGRTKEGHIVTWAQGGQSPHNCVNKDGKPASMAFDFVPVVKGVAVWNANDPLWATCIKVGVNLGLESGANWPKKKRDMPHMQLANWKNITPL